MTPRNYGFNSFARFGSHFFTIFRIYSFPSASLTRNRYTPAGTLRTFTVGESVGEFCELRLSKLSKLSLSLASAANPSFAQSFTQRMAQ